MQNRLLLNRLATLVIPVLIALMFASASQAQAPKKKKNKQKEPRPASIVWVNKLEDSRGRKTMPSSTKHLTFHSELVNQNIGYCVYLPPSYEKNSASRYPVTPSSTTCTGMVEMSSPVSIQLQFA